MKRQQGSALVLVTLASLALMGFAALCQRL